MTAIQEIDMQYPKFGKSVAYGLVQMLLVVRFPRRSDSKLLEFTLSNDFATFKAKFQQDKIAAPKAAAAGW